MEAKIGISTILDGMVYKIGVRGKSFYWNLGEWRASTKSPSAIKAGIQRDINKLNGE